MADNDWKSSLTLPVGSGALTFDLTQSYQAELRIPEVAFVTPQKAGELLATFNVSILDLAHKVTQLELEVCRAKRSAARIHSRVVLDETKDILKAKGLAKDSNPAGSADLREAVLEGHDEYQQALETVELLEAASKLLQNRKHGIELAYHSVKRLLGESGFYYRDGNLSGSIPENVEVGGVVEPSKGLSSVPARRGFSKPVF